jgi:hypothetical protein
MKWDANTKEEKEEKDDEVKEGEGGECRANRAEIGSSLRLDGDDEWHRPICTFEYERNARNLNRSDVQSGRR